ncbi:MAG: AbgT family transporter [Planctomycetota bacterium]
MSEAGTKKSGGPIDKFLNFIEYAGNKLPDPAMLFLALMMGIWLISWPLSMVEFDAFHPVERDSFAATAAGTVAFANLEIGSNPDRPQEDGVVVSDNCEAIVTDADGKEVERIEIPRGATVDLEEGAEVEEGTEIGSARQQIRIKNIVSGEGISSLLTSMVSTFVTFPPLGVVLVALLGIGVAEHTGLISAVIKFFLTFVPKFLLTPAVIFVGVLSHYAVDAGYVLVIPVGGIIFYAAGRHPLAGIAAAFAGVSGGFSANVWFPSGLDPLLQGFTLSAAQMYDPAAEVSVLNNNNFTLASTFLIVIVGWLVTDLIVEPRVSNEKIDGDEEQMPKMEKVTPEEIRGMIAAILTVLVGIAVMFAWGWSTDSSLRFDGSLTNFNAPLMKMIVPLIFLFSIIPAVVHGYVSGSVKSHKDIVKGMSKAMETMGYYIVLSFFCALFIWMFSQSQIGILLAVKGAAFLKALNLPGPVTIFGIILLVGMVNLLVGSASAKWALISAVFVPMLMELGLSPDLTQAAYRVGDSSTNIITPLMPYFPLVVVFCQRYVKKTGIGTLVSMMLPYTIALLITWSLLLIGFWMLDFPLGTNSTYEYIQATSP